MVRYDNELARLVTQADDAGPYVFRNRAEPLVAKEAIAIACADRDEVGPGLTVIPVRQPD